MKILQSHPQHDTFESRKGKFIDHPYTLTFCQRTACKGKSLCQKEAMLNSSHKLIETKNPFAAPPP